MPKSKGKKGASEQHFRSCIPPCTRFISPGDTHDLCVVCLRAEHAQSALEKADCYDCELLPLRVLRSRLAVFDESGQPRDPVGSGPAVAEAQRRLLSWGSQVDLTEGYETGSSLSHASSARSNAPSRGAEARVAVSSPKGGSLTLHLSSSEEVEVMSVDTEETVDSPPQSLAYEELVEVVTRAVAKLNIDWPAEQQDVRPKSKLDERFLRTQSQLSRRGLPFFPDLHTEVSRSWEKPFSSRIFSPTVSTYSNVVGLSEKGYGAVPTVERTLASYLSPSSASSLKAPQLPFKALKRTSALVGKAYTAAVAELRRATDLSLRATKETARAIGRSMAALVAMERHLWLNLSELDDKDRFFLLDASLSPSGLFGDAVNSVVDRFQEAKKQAAAFQRFLPRRQVLGAAEREQPQPSGSSYRQSQRQSVASRTPPKKDQGSGRRSRRSGASRPKADLRAVLQAKRGLADNSATQESGALGLSELRRANFPAAARKWYGTGQVAPPRGCQPRGAGTPKQLTRGQPREAGSLSRLSGSVEASAKCLTVGSADCRKRLQNPVRFSCTSLCGGPSHFGGPPADSGDGARSRRSPEEGSHRGGSSSLSRESGFYSRYFIVPKKDGGLRPIIDLRLLNRAIKRFRFKMLTIAQIVTQIRSKDWFVTIDLKDAYFHISILPEHRKFLRFAFGGEAYQYRVLPFGLSLSPRTFTKCVDAALAPLRLQGIRILNYIDDWLILAQSQQEAIRHRDRSRPHETAGVKTERQKKCTFSITEDHLSGRGVGFDDDAGTSVSCSYRVDPHYSQGSERRPVTHCKTVSETVRSDGSCVQCGDFWPAVHETSTVAQNQRVFPEGKSTSYDQGHAAMLSCLRHVERPSVSVSRPGVGGSLSSCNANDGCLPHGLGSGHEWPLCPGSVGGPSSYVAHQLPGDAGGVSWPETFPLRPQGAPRACSYRQHNGSRLYQPAGGSSVTPPLQAGVSDPPLGPGETPVLESDVYTWAPQSGSSHPVETGAEARGVETPPTIGGAPMEGLLWGWMPWYRHGRVCVCMPFPRLLCSREFWRECVRTGSVFS
ncbi:hypothetical protein QQF64_031297 [Cirrhinus molitorella]|uniref:ribonuclease H n=1 Tax=Cirrhinus molitorella TaxID=172907 RepID=A0ABR3MWI6_9TELE